MHVASSFNWRTIIGLYRPEVLKFYRSEVSGPEEEALQDFFKKTTLSGDLVYNFLKIGGILLSTRDSVGKEETCQFILSKIGSKNRFLTAMAQAAA